MRKAKEQNSKKKYFPSSFLIIILLMFFFIVISWICQAAKVTTEVYNAETGLWENVKIQGLGLFDFLAAIWTGFKDRADVILFIFAIGGTLGVMARTKAIDAGIEAVIKKMAGKEILIIPVLMFIFGLGGTTYGMWEETLAFFPILIPIFIKAKFGPFMAVLTILLGAGAGNLSSSVNPFAISLAFDSANSVPHAANVHITQSIMMGSRWVSFIIFESVAAGIAVFMALRIRSGKLVMSGLNETLIASRFVIRNEEVVFTVRRKITLSVFISGFLFMILAYLPWSQIIPGVSDGDNSIWNKYFFWISSTSLWGNWGTWYFISIASIFLLISLTVFAINLNDFVTTEDNKEGTFISTFINGAKDVLPVCLLIATAAGLGVILSNSNLGPWIANSVSGISSMGPIGFVLVIFILSLLLSMLIPSTSGFSAAFIPIFAAIVYKAFGNESASMQQGMVGLVVMAFIFASGIANLFTPTSAALMAYTQYAGVPYNVWLKRIFPTLIIFTVMAVVILIIFAGMLQVGIQF